MNIQLKLPGKVLSTSVLCGLLTACGGGGSDGSIDDGMGDGTNNSGSSGTTIDSSNYLTVFQTGVTGSAKLLAKVMFTGDDIDPDTLTVLNSTATSITYACDNAGGTILITQVNSDTQEWLFNDCHITSFTPDIRYHGMATVNTVMNTGSLVNHGSYFHDWSSTQVLVFNNYTETSPITGGSSSTSNGTVFKGSSNNLNTQVSMDTLSGTDLSIDSVDASGTSTGYYFSDISYLISEDTSTDTSYLDLAYTANISGIGDVQVNTAPPIVIDANEVVVSGESVILTGSSTAKMVATGNNNIQILLDSDNNGAFEEAILSTWSEIGGD